MFLPANEPNDLLGQLRCLQSARAKRQFRLDIFEAWEGCCAYCGRSGADTLDHLKPRAHGGQFVRRNLIPACKRCNMKRSTTDWLTWYSSQSFFVAERAERIRRWMEY